MSVSYVLARAAEEGITEAVIGAAAPFDPLLRGSIRKSARQAIAEAGSLTRVTDEAHVIRVAFLHSIRRTQGVPLDDRSAVEQAFLATKFAYPRKKRAFWPLSMGLAGVVAIAGLVGAFFLWSPSKSDRFAHSAVGEAFGEGVTDWVIGVDRRDRGRMEKGKNALVGRGVKSQAGQGAVDQIGDALDHAYKISEALSAAEADHERERAQSALRGLDSTLASKKVPAFLDEHDEDDAFTGVRHVWLLGYYAEQRADLVVGRENFYVLWGRRLDTLNIDVGGVVYGSDALKASIVAIDEVEAFVTRRILPGLGKDAALAFGAEPAAENTGLGRMETKMGTALRSELLPAVGLAQDEATELTTELASRHSAFGRLHVIGDDMYEPRGIRMPEKMRRGLTKRDSEVDAKEILRIDDHLQRTSLVRGYDALTVEQAKIAERRYVHDAYIQHRSGTITTGTFEAAAGKDKLSVRLSATAGGWLGAVADSERTILALTDLARQQDADGSVNLALFALESELGSSPTWLVNGRLHDEEDALRALEDALKRPPDAIKHAAAGAYSKLLGEPLPTVTRKLR